MTRLDRYGPWALVTGASDGIGQALARQLAAARLNIVLVARRENTLHALAAELTTAHNVQTRVVAVDFTTPHALEIVENRTSDLDVGVAVLAAGFGHAQPFLDSPLRSQLDMIAVNVTAVAALTHSLGQRMAARGSGAIVLFGSLLGWHGVPGQVTYAATKAYVQALAEGLGRELAQHGVGVLAVAPGPVHSGFAQRAGMTISFADSPEAIAAATLSALGRSTTVVPGWRGKMLTAAMTTLPRRIRIMLLGRIVTGMRTPGSTG
jgi:uncharacterized protein